MKMHRKINKKKSALIITAVVFSVIGVLHFCGAFHYLENKSYDLRVRFFANSTRPSDDIIVILLDQDSIDWAQQERGWGWPWPRRAYGELLDYMHTGNAEAVVIDIIFSEPSIYGEEDDESFIRAGQEYGRAVQVAMFSSTSGSARSWPPELESPLFEPEGFGSMLYQFGIGVNSNMLGSAVFPIKGLREGAAALGSATGFPIQTV
jgi:adenylate cyclase